MHLARLSSVKIVLLNLIVRIKRCNPRQTNVGLIAGLACGREVNAGVRGVRATAQFFVTRVQSRERVGTPRGVPRKERGKEREALSRPCTGVVQSIYRIVLMEKRSAARRGPAGCVAAGWNEVGWDEMGCDMPRFQNI